MMAYANITTDDDEDYLPDLDEILLNPKLKKPLGSTKATEELQNSNHNSIRVSRIANDAQSRSCRKLLRPSEPEFSLFMSEKKDSLGTRSKDRQLKKLDNNTVLLSKAKLKKRLGADKTNQEKEAGHRGQQEQAPEEPKESIARPKPLLAGSSRGDSDCESADDSLAAITFWTNPKQPASRPSSKPTQEFISTPRAKRAIDRSTRDITKRSISVESEASEASEDFLPPPSPPLLNPPGNSHDHDNAAFLTYEPPRLKSPRKTPPSRPSTPPQSPCKLPASPSKAVRIPPAPHGPESDDFWNQLATNDWIDLHSPKKILASPRKNRFADFSNSDSGLEPPSPLLSPKKSPTKRTAVEREAKKTFDAQKHGLAEAFLAELDNTITDGKLRELTASTGGIKLVWSKKLLSTAGRANWRSQTQTTKHRDGTVTSILSHHAHIELAEKVIDDSDRLVNTLAHEFCHLANYMISGVKGNPHGKEFKEWAKKCSVAFKHHGVKVTTKHSYEIDYKYIWECTQCAQEYKRHSKSIDPERSTCRCRGRLIQTKPAVRNGKTSDYQLFVKEHFKSVKKGNPNATHGGVMEILGKTYREQKVKSAAGVEDLIKALETVEILD
jgi:predicted SprT family Zn-dependent metalloprotease